MSYFTGTSFTGKNWSEFPEEGVSLMLLHKTVELSSQLQIHKQTWNGMWKLTFSFWTHNSYAVFLKISNLVLTVRQTVCSLKTVRLIRPSWKGVSALDESGFNILSKVSFIWIDFVASFMPRSFDVIAKNPESNISGNKDTKNKETEVISLYSEGEIREKFRSWHS